jgi:chitodextrinase
MRSRQSKILAALPVIAALCLPASGLAAGLSVNCRVNTVNATDNQIGVVVSIVNGGTTAAALNTLTLRYWYTADGTQTQNYACDWAQLGCANVTAKFGTVSPAQPTADTYLELGFTGTGTIAAGQASGDIQGRIWKSDWSNFNEANDYSYVGSTTYAACPKITLYQSGVLVSGTPPTTTADTTPPTAPTNLASPSKTSTSVSLSWTASTDNVGVTGYNVYNGTTLATSVTTTSATVSGLTANTSYSFTVRAKDAAGNLSTASSALSVRTSASTDTTAPTAPTGLTASAVTSSSVTLSWTASTDNVGVTGYDVYNGTTLAASVTTTSANLSGLAANTTYSLTVRAKDAAGNVSAASAALSVKTSAAADTTPPTAPTGLTASAVTTSSVTLSWTASTDNVGVTGYDVYNGTALAASVASTSVSVSGLAANTTYSFTVKAKDAAGNVSAASAALSVKTSAATTDTTAPTTPAGLTASAVTSSSVTLTWTASTDNVGVTAYDVYNGTTLATSVATTSATVSGLAASTSYGFTVSARDAAGNVSAASASLGVQTAAASTHTQAPYPTVAATTCGSWALVNNVCVPQYCSDNLMSEDCSGCGGNSSATCQKVSGKAGMSGIWPEVHSVSTNEPWHYSRSTHFGLTNGGACGFGYYGLCNNKTTWTDPNLAAACTAFCTAYPALCTDPANISLRGNFAAPQGNYYTQFWPSLTGDRDNYLSCGECFELVRTKADGTDYATGETGYTPSVVLQIVDSCPCSANSKWCCGSGRDHCGEISGASGFKYGCQLPPAAPYTPATSTVDRDPLPNESIHLDLSDIAMARLQTGSPNGGMVDGVIPTRYRRVPCPVVGNVYIWLRSGASPYYFALSVMNMAGLGSATLVEAQDANGNWISMVRDQNYTSSRPQERYGAWVVPQGSGPFNLPVSLRITDGSGVPQLASGIIKSWTPASSSMAEMYYIDTGLQF